LGRKIRKGERAVNAETGKPIPFTRGNPAVEALPLPEIIDCANTVFENQGRVLFQYGHYSGYAPLREWIAERFHVKIDQVLMGNGSLEFLAFIGALMVERGDTVYVERPSYDRAITTMKLRGANVVGIPLEPDGVDIERLKEALRGDLPKLFYMIPDFQNPSGVTTSLEKRKEIARLAEHYGFLIIEDGPYRHLRYRGQDIPTLKELVPHKVIHISSFSKILSPGIRVGFLIGPMDLMPKLHKWSEDSYIHPVLPTEGIVYEYCRRGLLEPNIERLKALYRPRMQAMLEALEKYMEGAEWIRPEGGFFISTSLPEHVDGKAVRENAKDFGIVLSDGRGFFPDQGGENFVRLPFCALTPAEIEEGIRRLTRAIETYQQQVAHR
jgi:2-aminoadipate transaminase